jgi:hypothetical protein
MPYLHSHQTIIDQYLLCQKICPYRGLVAGAELLIDLFAYQSAVLRPDVEEQYR